MKKKLEVIGQNLNKCNEVYRRYIRLDSSQICAEGERGGDSCPGDSGELLRTVLVWPAENVYAIDIVVFVGGPLIAEDNSDLQNPYYYLAGIVSFGHLQCGTPGKTN